MIRRRRELYRSKLIGECHPNLTFSNINILPENFIEDFESKVQKYLRIVFDSPKRASVAARTQSVLEILKSGLIISSAGLFRACSYISTFVIATSDAIDK